MCASLSLTLCFRKLQTDAVLTTEARLQQNFDCASAHISSPISRWRLNSGSNHRDHEGVRADRTTKELQQKPGPSMCLMSMQSLMGQMKSPGYRSLSPATVFYRKQQTVLKDHITVMTD